MDAFESLIAMILRRRGYWTAIGAKVELTNAEKERIGRRTSPRWEIDVVAYSGARNEILAIECKSFLDSTGVIFGANGFSNKNRYKLFTDNQLRRTVLTRLKRQLISTGACASKPSMRLCLAAGKIAGGTNRDAMKAHFIRKKWELYDENWIVSQLIDLKGARFENDVAYVVAKLLLRNRPEVT